MLILELKACSNYNLKLLKLLKIHYLTIKNRIYSSDLSYFTVKFPIKN